MQFIINGLVIGSIYTLVALGFTLVYRVSRFFDFAQAGVFTVTAYCAYSLRVEAALPFWLAGLVACASAGVMGGLVSTLIYKPLRGKRKSSALFLASLGIYIVTQNVVSLLWGDNTKTLRVGPVVTGFDVVGARITRVQLGILCVTAVLLAVLAVIMHSRVGIYLRCLANDPFLARAFGLRVDRLEVGAATLASLLTGGGALLLSLEVDLTPSGGFKLLIMGMIGAVLGGLRSLWGAAAGGVTLGLAQNVAVLWFPTKWQDGIAFLLLILCLLLRPEGILGAVVRQAERRPRG